VFVAVLLSPCGQCDSYVFVAKVLRVVLQALMLDDEGLYSERLQTLLTRLQLRASLYTTPERPEDLATMIIEQVRACGISVMMWTMMLVIEVV
jgi:hypothetical protein